MSAEDFFATHPVEPLGPEALGLAPPPQPPQPLALRAPSSRRNPADLAALAVAAMLGPGAGTGVLQGMQQARQRERDALDTRNRQAQDLYRQQEQLYRWEQQHYDAEADRRQQTLQQNVKAIQQIVPTLKTKADYDRTIETFATGLQQMGIRVTPNYLRSVARYVAPDAKQVAEAALAQWSKSPFNETLLKTDPQRAFVSALFFDRDGDGQPERVTVLEAMELAGMRPELDASGKVLGWTPPNTSRADAMSEQAEFEEEMALARAEGKDVDSSAPPAIRARQALRDRIRVRHEQQKVRQVRAEADARRVGEGTKAPDKEWVIRQGQPMQIDKGTAQPGDRPYNAADAKLNATAADVRTKRATLAENAIAAIDALRPRDARNPAAMQDAPGFVGLFGAPSVFEPGSLARVVGMDPMAGSAGADAKAALDRLLSLITLPELQNMRGLGAMSDREFATISKAASSLSTRMSDRAARAELARLRRAFEDMRDGQAGTPVGDIGTTGPGRRVIYDINGNPVE